MEARLLRIPEVARALGISRSAVYVLLAEGKLQPVRIGRSVRVPADEIDAFVDRLTKVEAGR